MKKTKYFLGVTLVTLITLSSVFAEPTQGHSKAELNDYLQIQTLLSKDTLAGVSDAAHQLSADAKTHKHTELQSASDKLAGAKDIAEARTLFIPVSNQILPLAKSEKDKSLVVVYCPMKKARWVQKDGDIANPYYGKEMLTCGVKEK